MGATQSKFPIMWDSKVNLDSPPVNSFIQSKE